MPDDPKPDDPKPDDEPSFDTIGDLIDEAVNRSRKAWAKDLAELLDIGADSSDGGKGDPPKSDPPPDPPKPAPVTRSRRWSFL